jgi:hypothetical protein
MPITYSIDAERGIVFATVGDELSLGDTLLHVQEVFADPRFRPGMAALFDARQASLGEFSGDELRRVLSAIDSRPASLVLGVRWAIVVSREIDFAVSRMFEGLSGHLPVEIHVFRSYETARAWIEGGEDEPGTEQS